MSFALPPPKKQLNIATKHELQCVVRHLSAELAQVCGAKPLLLTVHESPCVGQALRVQSVFVQCLAGIGWRQTHNRDRSHHRCLESLGWQQALQPAVKNQSCWTTRLVALPACEACRLLLARTSFSTHLCGCA